MSGQWWESNLIVGPFANITEANAWAAANPSSLFLGLLATSNGQQISWRGAAVGWADYAVSNGVSMVASFQYAPADWALGTAALQFHYVANKLPCPKAFNSFRLRIPSGDSSVLQYTYAFSESPTDDGSSLSWSPVLFGASASVTRSTSGEIISDVINYVRNSSLPLYLYIRSYSESAGIKALSFGQGNQYFSSCELAIWGDYAMQSVHAAGKSLTSGALLPGPADWAVWQITGADFFGPKCFTIGGVGDSLDQGWSVNGATSSSECNDRYPVKFAAKALHDLGYSVGYKSLAVGGEKHSVSMAKLDSLFGIDLACDITFLRTWSPNSVGLQYVSMTETRNAVNKIKSNGSVPVVVTPTPVGASPTLELLRLATVDYSVHGDHGGVYLDINAIVADPNAPQNILPAYRDASGNTTHMSTLGYSVVGSEYAKIAKSIMNSLHNGLQIQ